MTSKNTISERFLKHYKKKKTKRSGSKYVNFYSYEKSEFKTAKYGSGTNNPDQDFSMEKKKHPFFETGFDLMKKHPSIKLSDQFSLYYIVLVLEIENEIFHFKYLGLVGKNPNSRRSLGKRLSEHITGKKQIVDILINLVGGRNTHFFPIWKSEEKELIEKSRDVVKTEKEFIKLYECYNSGKYPYYGLNAIE